MGESRAPGLEVKMVSDTVCLCSGGAFSLLMDIFFLYYSLMKTSRFLLLV